MITESKKNNRILKQELNKIDDNLVKEFSDGFDRFIISSYRFVKIKDYNQTFIEDGANDGYLKTIDTLMNRLENPPVGELSKISNVTEHKTFTLSQFELFKEFVQILDGESVNLNVVKVKITDNNIRCELKNSKKEKSTGVIGFTINNAIKDNIDNISSNNTDVTYYIDRKRLFDTLMFLKKLGIKDKDEVKMTVVKPFGVFFEVKNVTCVAVLNADKYYKEEK